MPLLHSEGPSLGPTSILDCTRAQEWAEPSGTGGTAPTAIPAKAVRARGASVRGWGGLLMKRIAKWSSLIAGVCVFSLSPSPSFGMAMQPQSQEYVCEATQSPNPFPTFDAPHWGLGPSLSNTADYERLSQRVLFGVPMAVWVDNDTDQIQGRCRGATGSACGDVIFSELSIKGSFDTTWQIKPQAGQSGICGSFMLTTGEGASGYFDSQALTVSNQDAVVYLPPNTLYCGATPLNFEIWATVSETRQAEAGLVDGGCTLKFPVRITTLPSGLKSIKISMPTQTPLPDIPQPQGLTIGGLCAPRFTVESGNDIQGGVQCNEFVGTRTVLPVVASYEDHDTVQLACGEGSGGCYGASPVATFSCKLKYTWELVSAPSGVSIIPQTEHRNTALLKIGSEVGDIHLRVKIEDELVTGVGGNGGEDADVQIDKHIRVVDLSFINQANVAVPREHEQATDGELRDACLLVSERVTTADINNSSTANWIGPVPPQSGSRDF